MERTGALRVVSDRDQLLHDLSDRLNGVTISVELALRLLKGSQGRDVPSLLERVLDDCNACSRLMAELRDGREADT